MAWSTVNINDDGIALAVRNQTIQESDLMVRFFFDGKRDVLINGVQGVMEGVDCRSFNDTKAAIYVTFPYFWWNGSCRDDQILYNNNNTFIYYLW